MEMVIEAGKDQAFSTLATGASLLEGSKKGAGNSQHASAPSRATTDLVTMP
jgi:hypothetical protein